MKKRTKRVVTIAEGFAPTLDRFNHSIILAERRNGVLHKVRVKLDITNGWFAQQLALAALEAVKVVRESKAAS